MVESSMCFSSAWERPDLAALQVQVRALERYGHTDPGSAVPLGIPAFDQKLAGGGLAVARVHEIVGEARSEVRDAAVFGFTAALLARMHDAGYGGDVLWCVREAGPFGGALCARGLASFGLDPARMILVEARGEEDRLRAIEDGLRCPGLGAVVGELGPVRAREGVVFRRLQLAAETSGVTGFLVRPDATGQACASGKPESRWQIRSIPAAGKLAAWQVSLCHSRNGRPGQSDVTWDGIHLNGMDYINNHSAPQHGLPLNEIKTGKTAA